MRKSVWLGALLSTVAAVAVAAPKQSAKVEIPYEASWAGKSLPAGEYTFKWEGDQGDVAVTVLRGRQVIAEGHARIEQSKVKAEGNAVVARPQDSGPRQLTAIQFGGKTMMLVLAQS